MKKILSRLTALLILAAIGLSAGAAATDGANLTYKKLAIAALQAFDEAMRNNASDIAVTAVTVISFPQGFTREYSVRLSGETASGVLTEQSMFCLIRYTEQDKCGTKLRNDYPVFVRDIEQFLEAAATGDEVDAKTLLYTENKQGWVRALYDLVMEDDAENQAVELDLDDMMAAYKGK